MKFRFAWLAGAAPALLFALAAGVGAPPREIAAAPADGAGRLLALDAEGEPLAQNCPLEHTAVRARIAGFESLVTVQQRFSNPYDEAIEAVYVFPLPHQAAVNDMTIRIGERTVRGVVQEREQARKTYEQARERGQLAALLDQERPNVFTQAVANIPPGETVVVEIRYIETLAYEDGRFPFVFPAVVGPRYIPDGTPDAGRITPPVTPPETRAGHDLSIQVELDAGTAVRALSSKSHEILVERPSDSRAVVRLKDRAVLPNKDFTLEYDVRGDELADAVLSHHDGESGYFSLVLHPPNEVTVEDVTPKELVFVLDVSGSMSGFPIEKAKETMQLALEGLYPRDTFNLITFAGQTKLLFPAPVPATRANLAAAQRFLESRQGGGGTEMMTAIRTALEPSDDADAIRIVCFMTDGYVGNDMAILEEVQRHPNARVFSFGVGSSVNRFLLDKMAEVGRGEVEYVSLDDDGSAAARRFHERVRNPLLTDIALDFGGLPVADVYPRRIPDLFSAKPVTVAGRFTAPAQGEITLRGRLSGRAFERSIPVSFSAKDEHASLAPLWARARIDHLMKQDYGGVQRGATEPEVKAEIIRLGVAHRLVTQFTSFVAVEETVVTEGGRPRRIEVPVEMPHGVSYEGVFGAPAQASKAGFAGSARGVIGGVFRSRELVAADVAVAPAPPPVEPEESARPEAFVDDPADKLGPGLAPKLGTSGETLRLEVWLTDATPEALAKLRALGFREVKGSRVAKIRFGEIDSSRLEALAKLTEVRLIRLRP